MSEINTRDLQCENCRKFSHCNNNELVCISKFKQLKAENEQLYKEKEQLQKSQYCVAYEKDCRLVCKQSGCKLKDYHKYKQCLDEIFDICNECQKHTDNVCETCKYCDKCINDFITNDVTNFILKKIKQAKEGE